jgi:hypothetical protein
MAGEFTGSATALAHLTPRPVKGLFGDNYLAVGDLDFTQQFLPEVYEKEVERYGNRTISGFLRMVGAEMPMASDVITWSEQGRLHIAYDDAAVASATTLTLPAGHLIGKGMTLVVSKGFDTQKAYVQDVVGQTVTVDTYGDASGLTITGSDVKVFVYGSEYAKGTSQAGNSVDASFTTFNNKPIILRDKYNVNGSDVAQIGWVEVTTEAGTSGYLWYLKSEHEARIRFEDQLEMAMVEAEKSTDGAGNVRDIAAAAGFGGGANVTGSEGLFAALEDRGLVYADSAFGGADGLADFDTILAELDKQGAIEENMLFLDRGTSLAIDNMLAAQNSYGAGGTSYGVFDNSEDMALNLGFSGFRRGSYDFYKTDWKYLNDATTRGLVADVEGVLVPRLKSWVTGSVGGNYTSDADEMNVHFLSERALCVQAANNFVLLKAIAPV